MTYSWFILYISNRHLLVVIHLAISITVYIILKMISIPEWALLLNSLAILIQINILLDKNTSVIPPYFCKRLVKEITVGVIYMNVRVRPFTNSICSFSLAFLQNTIGILIHFCFIFYHQLLLNRFPISFREVELLLPCISAPLAKDLGSPVLRPPLPPPQICIYTHSHALTHTHTFSL